MHLFIVHQFPDLDNFIPIILNLKKNTKSNFGIMNIYPIHDIQYYNLNNFLLKNQIKLINISDFNFKVKIILLLLKIILIFPKKLIKSLNRLWYYLYHNYLFLDKYNLIKLVKKNKIQTINIDDALPFRYKKIIASQAKKLNIKIIKYKLGVELRKKIYIDDDFLSSDFAIVQDYSTQFNVPSEIKKKLYRITNSRYSKSWLRDVESEYNYKLDYYNPHLENRKLKVLLITRPLFSDNSWSAVKEEILKNSKIELKIKLKPRGQFAPLQIQDNILNEYKTSELINWADVIVSHATSVLMEAIVKNKKILFLEYLFKSENKKKIEYVFKNKSFIKNINSLAELFIELEKIGLNKKTLNNSMVDDEEKLNFLTEVLGKNWDKENLFENNFLSIYKNI